MRRGSGPPRRRNPQHYQIPDYRKYKESQGVKAGTVALVIFFIPSMTMLLLGLPILYSIGPMIASGFVYYWLKTGKPPETALDEMFAGFGGR